MTTCSQKIHNLSVRIMMIQIDAEETHEIDVYLNGDLIDFATGRVHVQGIYNTIGKDIISGIYDYALEPDEDHEG